MEISVTFGDGNPTLRERWRAWRTERMLRKELQNYTEGDIVKFCDKLIEAYLQTGYQKDEVASVDGKTVLKKEGSNTITFN